MFRASLLLPIHIGMLLVCTTSAPAGTVTFVSADLRATVSGDALTVGGGPTSHAEDSDTGNLTDRNVSAEATASLPFSGTDFPVSRNDASATISEAGGGIRIDGTANSVVFVKSSPFTGKGSASSLVNLLVKVDSPGAYRLAYDAMVTALTPNGNTRLKIDLLDQASNPVSQITLASRIVQETQADSRVVNLAAGNYALSVDAAAAADMIGGFGAGDSGNIQFAVTLADASGGGGGGGVVIPLPAGVWMGLAMLPVLFWGMRKKVLRIA